jgi:SAM-dependent methyltransferase
MKNKLRRVKHILNKFGSKKKYEHYWEHFNRQSFVSEGIKLLGLEGSKILDVGGATGNNLLLRFGMKNVTTLDIDPSANIVANAADIPLEDRSYDVVTCIDMLEHVVREDRGLVVGELIRVAEKAVFLVAPADSPENNLAEKLVLKYLDCDFVKDHQLHGLVDFEKIRLQLQDMQEKGVIEKYEEVALDNLHSWVLLMTRGYVSESRIYQEAFSLENRFYPKRIGFAIYKK